MRAEEQWRRDHYDDWGINSGFNLEWRGVGKLPKEISDNIYSILTPFKGENPYYTKWRSLITWLLGLGIKDTPPKSPEEVARFHRHREREESRRQEELDKREED